jgi:hypothetical protein
VLDSLLLALTVTAVALLAPAHVALRRTGRHAHVGERGDSARRVRVVAAATVLGLASLGISALTGAGPAPSVVVAVVVAGGVVVNARLHRSWAVRGLAVWTLVVVAGLGLVAWLLHRTLVSAPSAPVIMTAGPAWLVLVYAVLRLRGPLRGRVEALAAREARSAPTDAGRPGALAPIVAGLAAAGLVAVVTVPLSPGAAPDSEPSQAGRTSTSRPSGTPASPPATLPEATGAPDGSAPSEPGPTETPTRDAGVSTPTAVTTGSTTTTATPVATTSSVPVDSTAPVSTEATKTPGWVKNSAKRPSGAPSPTPGGPARP